MLRFYELFMLITVVNVTAKFIKGLGGYLTCLYFDFVINSQLH